MSWTLDFHPEVREEVDAAREWYELRRLGLGAEFLDEIERVTEEISRNPSRFGFFERDIREGLLSRFPYAIYYRVLSDRIRILATYHTARDSSAWRARS